MNRAKFQIIGFGMAATLTFSLTNEAFAKTGETSSIQYHFKKKSQISKKAPPEVYPALESDEGDPISTAIQRPNTVEHRSTPIASQRSEKPKDYDVVPEQLSSPLIRRLQLVQILIQKYNRAYDYRSHTTADLERILIDLNSKQNRHVADQQVTMAPASAENSSGDAEKASDPLFSGNIEEENLILEALPDLPPPNPA